MKLPSVVFVGLLLVLNLQAEDTAVPAVFGPPAVIGTIADGSQSLPAPVRIVPELSIIGTITKRVVREEPAPLPDMQPVRKRVTITKHLVEEPVYPKLPRPELLDQGIESAAAAVARPDESATDAGEEWRASELVILSATVYDHNRTLLRWMPPGKPGDEMTAWSNVDFNLLGGFTTFQANGMCFSLILCLDNQNSGATTDDAEVPPPDLPALSTAGPAFVVTAGDANDMAASAVITGLHDLYQTEAPRLQAAYLGREKARIAREALLRAHPPQPRNVTTWITKARIVEKPADQSGATQKEVQP